MSSPRAEIAIIGTCPPGVTATTVQRLIRGVLTNAPGGRSGSVTLRFASDRTVRRYNRDFRGVDRPTDVLSFPAGDGLAGPAHLGDLLISRDRVRVQSRREGLTMRRETEELVLHGILHLLGYDHEADQGEMNQLELSLRDRLLGQSGRPS